MKKPTEKQFDKIADELDCGIQCFFNKKTGELKSIFIADDFETSIPDLDQAELDYLENSTNYFKFQLMDSKKSFEMMSDFIDEINDENLKQKLNAVLDKAKPFRQFKNVIDNSGNFRQQWFDFKKSQLIDFAKKQIH